MRLEIESWLGEQELPAEALVAFDEGIVAYKAGAYRAALLFSYLGMGLTLRRRLLLASCPTGMPQPQWDTVVNKLRREDAWDAEVFDTTQRQKAPPIFVVEESLREEFRYWKNRRNDCAHYKRNEIGAPHVESFWMFLRSSLGRWVPNGSAGDILSRLERHFDANLTPPGADVSPLVRQIPHAVPQQDVKEFFDGVVDQFRSTLGNVHLLNRDAVAAILAEFLKSAPTDYAEEAAEWLRDIPERLFDTARRHPELVHILAGHPELVRQLWRSELFKGGARDLELYAALLRNNLIPDEQLGEAHERVVHKLSGEVPTIEQNRELAKAGFWAYFDEFAFTERKIDQFAWGNANARLVAWRLENHPFDTAVTEAICDTFGAEPYPFQVRDALKEMLAANPSVLAELERLTESVGREVPEALK